MSLKKGGLRESLRNISTEVTPAFFDVTITNTNSPVNPGDILTVDYSADNTGDSRDTQDIRLEIDSVQEDVDSNVTLQGGVSTTGTLNWDTTNETAADYTATVLSDNDSDSVTVSVESAIPDSETFEWGATEVISDRYKAISGTLDFSVVNDTSIEGDYLLQYDATNNTSVIIPTGETDYRLTEQGQPIFGVDMIMPTDDTARPTMGFGYDSNINGYEVNLDSDNTNAFRLIRRDAGEFNLLVSSTSTPQEGVRYFIAIDWGTDGTISVTPYEYSSGSYSAVETFSATDNTYTSGTIAFRSQSADVSGAKYDNFRWNPEFI